MRVSYQKHVMCVMTFSSEGVLLSSTPGYGITEKHNFPSEGHCQIETQQD